MLCDSEELLLLLIYLYLAALTDFVLPKVVSLSQSNRKTMCCFYYFPRIFSFTKEPFLGFNEDI